MVIAQTGLKLLDTLDTKRETLKNHYDDLVETDHINIKAQYAAK